MDNDQQYVYAKKCAGKKKKKGYNRVSIFLSIDYRMTHSHVVTQSNIDTIVALITKTIHQQGSVIVDIYDGPSHHDGIVEKTNKPENYVSCTEDDLHSDGAFASFINSHG